MWMNYLVKEMWPDSRLLMFLLLLGYANIPRPLQSVSEDHRRTEAGAERQDKEKKELSAEAYNLNSKAIIFVLSS